MKGIVFTEFLDLVGCQFGDDVVDRIIEESSLPSGAAYTAVGTYHHSEMMTLVQRLSEVTHLPVPELLRTHGRYLFTRFAGRYPQFFTGITSTFAFLRCIGGHIHVEVQKLYPDAELPSILTKDLSENVLELVYRSTRPLAAFAEGLMHGAIAHFGERIEVKKTGFTADGTYVRFELTRS